MLAVASPIGINENSWSHKDNEFGVGVGDTKYVTMDGNDDDDDMDELGVLPSLPNSGSQAVTPLHSRKSSVEKLYESRHSTNESLDLGNLNVSVGSRRSNSEHSNHSFHAVTGAETADNANKQQT